ncbi:MAG: S8 family serine peptidase [Actinomycetota bacterium]|nr:S8 family serine peptidase [Actinomycetota bacterium]
MLLATCVAPAAAETADPGATLTRLVQEVGGRGAATTPQHYAYLRKIDSHLQDVAASRLGTGSAASAAVAARRQGVTVSVQGAALVDVYVHGNVEHAAVHLRTLGMRVTAVSDRAPQRMVEGYLPPESIAPAAALAETEAIITTFVRVNTGSVTSPGDDATNGPEARALGPTGAGVLVGVISDSINQQNGGISASVNSLDLPADTVALADKAGGTDEGRAMAEILYDEAPGVSSIRFETASGGAAAKANAIDALVASGVKVIADDTGYPGEPFFQDDVVAQAVDRAKAAGVAYFISAGNDARNAWEGNYAPVPAGGATTNDFGSGDTIQTIGPIPAGVELDLVLQWAEPWGHVTTDLAIDVYVMNGTTATFAGAFNSANTVTGIPEEAFAYTAPAGPDTTIGIAIRRVSGSANPFMKYIAFTDGPVLTMGHPVASGSISPDAASASGALTIAAAPFDTPTTPEDFSSRGPVTHFFDADGNRLAVPEVRQKPDLAAPDGVSTSLASFTPFFGTSAAAPAAAGIAALIRSAKPAMAIDELYAIMTSPENALDCTLSAAVPDPDCGAGFVLADAAVAMALDATPPVVTPVVTPAAPDGANGWYRGPVTVAWDTSDPESPVVHPAGCGAASPGDGTSVLTCNATSAGGTTSVPLTIKRDSTAPSAPAITGIGAKTYLPATLPKASAVHCSAADPTSGIAGCTVAGYGTGPGAHTLTATATNAAGLTSTSTLRFAVAKPAAIARLRLVKSTLSKLRSSGLTLTVRVAAVSTRLVVKLVAAVPKAAGTGTRTIAVGALTTNLGAGAHTLRIRLTPAGKRALSSLSKATLKVAVTGSSTRAKAASLRGSLVVRH